MGLLVLIVLLLLWPVLEITVIVWLAQHWGLGGTLLVLLGGIVAGVALMRWQGFETSRRITEELRQGTMPADALVDGMLIFAAGILLLLPGLLSDVAAIGLLIPWTRSLFKLAMGAWFRANVVVQTHVTGAHSAEDVVIDSYVVRERTGESPDVARLEGPRETRNPPDDQ